MQTKEGRRNKTNVFAFYIKWRREEQECLRTDDHRYVNFCWFQQLLTGPVESTVFVVSNFLWTQSIFRVHAIHAIHAIIPFVIKIDLRKSETGFRLSQTRRSIRYIAWPPHPSSTTRRYENILRLGIADIVSSEFLRLRNLPILRRRWKGEENTQTSCSMTSKKFLIHRSSDKEHVNVFWCLFRWFRWSRSVGLKDVLGKHP